jgi:hypothetical protein
VSKSGFRAKGAFEVHPVIKNALPNSFRVTEYGSELGLKVDGFNAMI